MGRDHWSMNSELSWPLAQANYLTHRTTELRPESAVHC